MAHIWRGIYNVSRHPNWLRRSYHNRDYNSERQCGQYNKELLAQSNKELASSEKRYLIGVLIILAGIPTIKDIIPP